MEILNNDVQNVEDYHEKVLEKRINNIINVLLDPIRNVHWYIVLRNERVFINLIKVILKKVDYKVLVVDT